MSEMPTNHELAGDDRAMIIQKIGNLANFCAIITTAKHNETTVRQELSDIGDEEAKQSLPRIKEFNQDLRSLIDQADFTGEEKAVLLVQNRTKYVATAAFEAAKLGVESSQNPTDPYDGISTETLRNCIEKVEKIREILTAKYGEDFL